MPSGGGLQAYQQSLDELLTCLNVIHQKWQEYQDILDSGSGHCQLKLLLCTQEDEGGLDLTSPRIRSSILLLYHLHGVRLQH